MSAFDALRIAGSSLGMHQTWLDALAHNISNVNTVKGTDENAFQEQLVVAAARDEGGVDVAAVELGSPEGRTTYQPNHPLADAEGNVRLPDMELSDQMSSLVMAQRGFQASVQTTKHAQDTYAAALQIGR